MKTIRVDKNSIFFKMTSFVILLIILQAVLLTVTLIVGGVLEQARENAFQSFHDKVANRKDYIQREMKNRWTNMAPYVQQISKNLTAHKNSDGFFNASVDELTDMLRTTQATGAFVILQEDEAHYPALYIRDYDPLLNDYTNKDLYLVLGPAQLAKQLKIPLDQLWKYDMAFDLSNNSFFEKPTQNAALTYNTDLLAYWNPPFSLFSEDIEIITYTMPIFDADKKLRGVIGVELSVNYVGQHMPATDLQERDSMGYMVGYSGSGDRNIQPVLMVGALQKRMIRKDEVMDMDVIDAARNIYRLNNHNSAENIYACVEQIGLYNHNTPFEGENWFLIGMMTENNLLSYVRKIQQILMISFAASVAIGIIGGYVISYRFTKPITRLAKQVQESEKDKAIVLDRIGLSEIDALSGAMAMANNDLLESTVKMSKIIGMAGFPIGAFEIRSASNHVFITDQLPAILDTPDGQMQELVREKNDFLEHLQGKMKLPLNDDEYVYQINGQDVKYIKVKIVENEASTIGVVIDVTLETQEKNRIKKERDYDPLTMIYNRKAVQERIEKIITGGVLDTAALIMFDLDNLKQVNDTYGHEGGDLYLKRAVEHLSTIGGKQAVLGRRSGDEFVLFLYGFPDRKSIREEMDGFYRRLTQEQLIFSDGSQKPITISGGLLWIENWTLGYDDMLQKADSLLYKAKNLGKGSYCESVDDSKNSI